MLKTKNAKGQAMSADAYQEFILIVVDYNHTLTSTNFFLTAFLYSSEKQPYNGCA